MAHVRVRHPAGDLPSCKSAILPICHMLFLDGTTHVVFEPVDFIARLAALVPKPRVNLTRFHGVFAPHSKHRAKVTPARTVSDESQDGRTSAEHHAAMTWSKKLKRVFNVDHPSSR